MNKLPLPKKMIKEAANAHALAILGSEEYEKNRTARRSIVEDFTTAAEWTMKAMLEISTHPDDQAHRMITAERLEQILRGYDAEHDAQYTKQELAISGILMVAEGTDLEPLLKEVAWPIKGYPDKRGKLDLVRQRVIGTGLIAGQIDLDIAKSKTPADNEGFKPLIDDYATCNGCGKSLSLPEVSYTNDQGDDYCTDCHEAIKGDPESLAGWKDDESEVANG